MPSIAAAVDGATKASAPRARFAGRAAVSLVQRTGRIGSGGEVSQYGYITEHHISL